MDTPVLFPLPPLLVSCAVHQLQLDAATLCRTTPINQEEVDSLDFVEFIMAIEMEFNIQISDDETAAWKTVGDVADLITQKQS